MPIPNPTDITASAAYVDQEGQVQVKAGMDAPQTTVGVVGFVSGMVMLWKGLAANKPKGWVIETAPAGSYLQIASGDGAVGIAGGSATAADHVHTHAHVHSLSAHTHTLSAHTHGLSNHTHNLANHTHNLASHTHDTDINHNHPAEDTGTPSSTITFDEGTGSSFGAGGQTHHHALDLPPFLATNTSTAANPNVSNAPNTNTSDTPSTNTSDVPSTPNASGPSTPNTGSESAVNTGGVVTTPIALTPLFYGLYLIRYTGAP